MFLHMYPNRLFPLYFQERHMIICLVGHERNLGILTLTDHLLSKLGKESSIVVGWNYLIPETESLIKKINDAKQINKNVVIKYVVPRNRFSFNQDVVYPDILRDMSDVVFKVPTYREEISAEVPKVFLKGKGNPIEKHFDEFYSITR